MESGVRPDKRVSALALLLLSGAAQAADLGVPRDGLDRVLLDDGRVVNARVLPREGTVVPLEFTSGTVRVPGARVREVRWWKDFDPAPRDEAEKAKSAQGFVRWNGLLVSPDRAKTLRDEEVEKERKALEAAMAAAPWDDYPWVDVARFQVASNAPVEEKQYWYTVLGAVSKQVTATLEETGYRLSVRAHLYRDDASLEAQKLEDRRISPDDVAHPGRRVDVVIGDRSRADLLPLMLRTASFRLCRRIMDYPSDRVGAWVRNGLQRYFAAGSFQNGVLHIGEVDDESLLEFREQIAAGKLPRIDDVLRSGNSYWSDPEVKETAEARLARILNPKDPFDPSCAPFAWVLVHFLLEGDDGKRRDDFLGWERLMRNGKISKTSHFLKSFPTARDNLTRQIRMKDSDALAAAAIRHAEGLKYRLPGTWLTVARKSWSSKRDAIEARTLVEEAVSRCGGNARALTDAGVTCAAIEGGAERAREILVAAVEADPLLAEARLALARLLSGDDGVRARRLGEELQGLPASGR